MTGTSGLIRFAGVSAETVPVGGELGFRVELLPPALPIELYLSVRYPDGHAEAIDLYAKQETAEMVWRVPPTAPVGPAEFSLFALRPCLTCGGGVMPTSDRVDGTFAVVDA